MDEEGLNCYRNALENQIPLSGHKSLVVGGDLNAIVRLMYTRLSVCAKYGEGIMNKMG